MLPHFKNSRFWLTGQANFVFQAHPDFPALYSGPHSLSDHYEKATSRVMTFYAGVPARATPPNSSSILRKRVARPTQGFGLAGNTDLDIVRNPLLSKTPYLGRADSITSSRSAKTRSRTSATICPFLTNCRGAASNSASASSACPISSTSTPSAPTPTSSSQLDHR